MLQHFDRTRLVKLVDQQGPQYLYYIACLILLIVIYQSVLDWFANPLNVDERINVTTTMPLVSSWHLLGNYQMPPRAIATSKLPLNLIGVMSSSASASAQAIIVSSDGQEKVYRPGDNLPGGVSLQEILPDAVLIQHNGHLEKLILPQAFPEWLDPPGE